LSSFRKIFEIFLKNVKLLISLDFLYIISLNFLLFFFVILKKDFMQKRYSINLTGLIQGVGFRPFIYRLAGEYNLSGWVRNSGDGVHIIVQGNKTDLDKFASDIKAKTPPGSFILDFCIREEEVEDISDFKIFNSTEEKTGSNLVIPPDVSVCEDCLEEMSDKNDRRYKYPFISCTYCGPRFTIIDELPYDRPHTTMDGFKLCDECLKEYKNPDDRRFHAQTTGCPLCGPRVVLFREDEDEWGNRAIDEAKRILEDGGIVAIKGIGGYCLSCDAGNSLAIKHIKKWKMRNDKPLAIMVRDVSIAKRFVEIDMLSEETLKSPGRPILLLKSLNNSAISNEIAPELNRLGIMLPNSPLHYQLMEGNYSSLVMTSANRKSEPIIYEDTDALKLIDEVCDAVLMSERPIYTRADDSVSMIYNNSSVMVRPGRGYSPLAIKVPDELPAGIGFGSDMKNTFCLIDKGLAYLSQHIGNLAGEDNFRFYVKEMDRYKDLLKITPGVYSSDLNPSYYSSKYADEINKDNHKVQHHHAHLVSVIAENGLYEGTFIGISADGTGYGSDGEVWGCEFMEFDCYDYKRLAHLRYLPLPGGEESIRRPYRMAISYLFSSGEKDLRIRVNRLFDFVSDEEYRLILDMIDNRDRRITPQTSSLGRLFDAVSAILGVCYINGYDAQASMMLETISDARQIETVSPYDYEITEDGSIVVDGIMKGILFDMENGVSKSEIATKFHKTTGDFIYNTLLKYYDKDKYRGIVASGGVFQNRTLMEYLTDRLIETGISFYFNKRIPANDAGISFGQAIIGGFNSLRS
jgi:hydrogenase maturation protein HypF